MTENDFTSSVVHFLFAEARGSIEEGFKTHKPLIPAREEAPSVLWQNGSSFVTLKIPAQSQLVLRGCIGTLSFHRPLYIDVAENAFSAAFRDPRFRPLTREEYPFVKISISILTPPVDAPVRSREELLETLKPGVDGLILKEGARQATFLPSVWNELPNPESFVEALLQKGGWPSHYWSEDMRVALYQSLEFSEDANISSKS